MIHSKRSRAVMLAALLCSATAVQANLVNGGFEDPGAGNSMQPWGGYTYGAGAGLSPSMPGWVVDAVGSVDIVPVTAGVWKPAKEGSFSLDLVGNTAGGISQSFSTVLGTSYTLSFWYSKNVASSPNPSTASVMLFDSLAPFSWSAPVSVTNAQAGVANAMIWLPFSHTFVGTGNQMTLAFKATNEQSQGGVFIDAVSVVPEPQAYALALAALGVLGVAARKRGRPARTS